MIYDLTSLFTTVAAASASIVAILGGFIASKLISIGTDRERILSKKVDLEKQLQYKQNEFDELNNKENEALALGFIRSNIMKLIHENTIEQAYETDIKQSISKEDITPFWGKALTLKKELDVVFYQRYGKEINNNIDEIPVELAQKYSNSYFEYSVLELICKKLSPKNKHQGFGMMPALDPLFIQPITGLSILEQKRKEELEPDIKWLRYQITQADEEIESLKKPKGMKAGLVIFALFSAFCIVLPLLLSPFTTESVLIAWLLKLWILHWFVAGLIAIFIYLVSLLRWRENAL